MFTRMNQITAIRKEVKRLLSHRGWKEFDVFFDRDAVGWFVSQRERAESGNPFRSGFDATKETRLFLEERLHIFAGNAGRETGYHRERYRYAAAELARILGVPVPQSKQPTATPYRASLPPGAGAQSQPRSDVAGNTTALLPGPWDAENPDERKLAAMERIINDRAAPLGEKLAAQAAYLRLRQKVRGY